MLNCIQNIKRFNRITKYFVAQCIEIESKIVHNSHTQGLIEWEDISGSMSILS